MRSLREEGVCVCVRGGREGVGKMFGTKERSLQSVIPQHHSKVGMFSFLFF